MNRDILIKGDFKLSPALVSIRDNKIIGIWGDSIRFKHTVTASGEILFLMIENYTNNPLLFSESVILNSDGCLHRSDRCVIEKDDDFLIQSEYDKSKGKECTTGYLICEHGKDPIIRSDKYYIDNFGLYKHYDYSKSIRNTSNGFTKRYKEFHNLI